MSLSSCLAGRQRRSRYVGVNVGYVTSLSNCLAGRQRMLRYVTVQLFG